jgi:MerR family transcriptional regulator, light-induced transcriptional regulator
MHLREAAETLGVHYQTAYGWVREGVLPARKVGRGYEVSDEDVRALRARRDLGREPAREVRVRDWPAQASRLYAAIAGGEETQARSGLERLAGSVPLADLCQRVIGPALRRIGDGWAAGRVSIAQEHRASAICERLIAIHAQQPAGRPRGIAVVTTPPGERHGLPALMAAACLREDRWLVHHLAADLPAAEIAQMAGQVGAGLIVLSCTTDQAVEQAGAVAAEITEAATATVCAAHPPAVLTGGPGDSLLDLLQQARDLRAQPAGARI